MSTTRIINRLRWDGVARQWGMSGGPGYSTQIVSVQSGTEQAAALWTQSLGKWDLGNRSVPSIKYQAMLDFFHLVRGRFRGFRVRDWLDYKDDGRGVFSAADSTGLLFQMCKSRGVAFSLEAPSLQKITRPVGSTFASVDELGDTIHVFRNDLEVPQGSGVGTCAVDDSTGLVTFNPYTYHVISVSSGLVTFSTTHSLQVGDTIQLSGYTGTDVANNAKFVVATVPNSTLVTIAGSIDSGQGATAAEVMGINDTLSWTGQYDLPARFDIDQWTQNVADTFLEDNASDQVKDVWVKLGTIPVAQLRE